MTGRSRRDATAVRRTRLLCAGIALCTLLFAASGGKASAADWLDDTALRGSFSSATTRWDGLYVGAHIGDTILNSSFAGGVDSLVAHILRNTTVENEFHPSDWAALPSDLSSSSSYGGFIGYNTQMDQLVLGFDIGYTHVRSLNTSSSDSISRIVHTSDGYDNTVTVTGQSSMKLLDYATLRGRAGYAIGQFLPYAMIGGAIARFNYANSATVLATGTDVSGGGGLPYTLGPTTNTNGKDNAFAAGLLVGAGLDVAITPNLFLRGEWEFVAFQSLGGNSSNINTVRAGVGIRF